MSAHNRNHAIGAWGEAVACRYLQRHGYRIIATNYQTSYKELDIIAQQGDVLVFVEVKTRTSEQYGDGTEALSGRKKQSLRQGINRYIHEQATQAGDMRADLITVLLGANRKTARIHHYQSVL